MRSHAGIRTHNGRQTTRSFAWTVRVEGAGAAMTGHQGSEEAHGSNSIPHFTDHEVIRRHAHCVVHPVCQGVWPDIRTNCLWAGFHSLDGRTVYPDFLRIFNLHDAPGLR